MDELAINWQNFPQVRLQLKFAFRIQPKDLTNTLLQSFNLNHKDGSGL